MTNDSTNDEMDALPDELAAAYRADPAQDPIDVVAGWKALRPQLPRRVASRRRRVVFAGTMAALALAASVVIVVKTKSHSPADTQPVTSVAAASPEYLQAVTDLETALRDGRERAQPQTMAAIEQSLATFDRAIHDAEAALIADPANEYAADWLETMRGRKLRALREAVADVDATS